MLPLSEYAPYNWKVTQVIVIVQINIAETRKIIGLAFLKITLTLILYGMCILNTEDAFLL